MTLRNIITATAAALALSATAAGVADFKDIDRYLGPEHYCAAPRSFTYTADGSFYLQLSTDGRKVVKYDTRTGKEVETIVDLANTRETTIDHIDGFKMSPDGRKVMVWNETSYIYRRSFTACYYIYDLHSRELKPLSTRHTRQQAPLFSPDGRMVAFVDQGNIYLCKLDFWTEVDVTTDGRKNEVINGVPDWTYEEEFTTSSSMTWSPDSRMLCYLKYRESDVRLFSFPLYEGYCHPDKNYALYPGQFTYKYPVAGEKNSTVSIHSYDIDNRVTKDITLPDSRIEYIPRIEYAFSGERLMVTTLNRAQTRMELYAVNPRSTVTKPILTEEHSAWLSPATYENIRWYPDFFVITSSRTGYDHLYRYAYTGAPLGQITSGDYDVTAYYGYDSKRACHYFQSTRTGAINRVVSRVDAKGKVTDLTPAAGTASATFSPDMAFYTVRFTDVTTPPVYTLRTSADKEIKVLEDNAAIKARYGAEPHREFFTMQSDGVTLNGYMLKPASFDPNKKHPVVMFQYSGPGSQQVLNEWNIGWMTYYTTRGYIIICVDGRGTGGRGRAFSDIVYKQLGHYETIDQINAARYAATLPFVDPSRIAIYGWSYGGYEALMCATEHNSPFAAAVAIAPVTDWRFYDTVYAERYMLTPQQNFDGYAKSAPLRRAASLACPLLIMSGTADDNVHISNTYNFVSKLQLNGGICDMFIFPGMNHSIYGCNSRAVVYAKMLDFLGKNMVAGRR